MNTVGSTIAREADGGIYLHAGPEVGVASTKAFSAQVPSCSCSPFIWPAAASLVPGWARDGGCDRVGPGAMGEVLKTEPVIEEAAQRVARPRSALYLGRDLHYPVALEGALKLKEISYIHAEGYPTAEMKHGPIALVDRRDPLRLRRAARLAARQDASNIEEVRAGGPVIAVGTEGDRLARVADGRLPADPRCAGDRPAAPGRRPAPVPGLSRRARRRGCDIDKPRNLAKSVTVE